MGCKAGDGDRILRRATFIVGWLPAKGIAICDLRPKRFRKFAESNTLRDCHGVQR